MLPGKLALLVLNLLIKTLFSFEAFELSPEEKLQEHFFSRSQHLPDIHPGSITSRNQSSPVVVKLDIQVIRVVEIDERDQSIQVYLWINQYWENSLFKWNASEFGGVKEIYVDKSKVWRPDIVLYNNVDSKQAGPMSEEYKTKIKIYNNGVFEWMNQATLTSICRIDVSSFPFDDQCCFLKFGSWAFDASKIDLLPSPTMGEINKFYMKNGEWEVISLNAQKHILKYQCCPNPFVDVTITIQLRRQALTHVLNLIVPCALLSSLVIMGYILPPESGERVGLTVALLLSVTVFQQLTNQIMPSYDFPYLAQYYWATIIQTGLSLVVTVIILNCYHRHHRQMHWLVRKIVLEIIGPCIFCKKESKNRNLAPDEESQHVFEEEAETEELLLSTKVVGRRASENGSLKQGRNGTHGPSVLNGGGPSILNGKANKEIFTRLAAKKPKRLSFVEVALQSGLETSIPDIKLIRQQERKMRLEGRQRDWLKAARILDRLFLLMSILVFFLTLMGVFFRAPRFWNDEATTQCKS